MRKPGKSRRANAKPAAKKTRAPTRKTAPKAPKAPKTNKAAKKGKTPKGKVQKKSRKARKAKVETKPLAKLLGLRDKKGKVSPCVLKAREDYCQMALTMDLSKIRDQFMIVIDGPTGTGKTQVARLLGLRILWLLDMARTIVASPYVALCRQTEGDWKRAINPGDVMRATHDVRYKTKAQKLKAKAFQYPVNIVSTKALMQALVFPESKKARSLHNSVVILDDPDQVVPAHAMRFFIDRCRDLNKRHGTFFILTSATFPEIWNDGSGGGDPGVGHLRLPEKILEALQNRYSTGLSRSITTLDQLAVEVLACKQKPTMVVLNTKKNARELFKKITVLRNLLPKNHPHKDIQTFFITTDVPPAIRREQEIKAEEAVDAGEPVIIIGTSCIQAGWDISCGTVFRENAGFTPLWQLAGRCNRNGELRQGIVIVFQLVMPESRLPDARIHAEILLSAYLAGERLDPTQAILTYLDLDPEATRKQAKLASLWKNYLKTGRGVREIDKLTQYTYKPSFPVMTPAKLWSKDDLNAMVNGRWSVEILRKYRVNVSPQDIKSMRILLSGQKALILNPEELDFFERMTLEGDGILDGIPFLADECFHPVYGTHTLDAD